MVNPTCLCHVLPGHGHGQPVQMCDNFVQTGVELVDFGVQVNSEDLSLEVSDVEVDNVKVTNVQVANVQGEDVKKPSQSFLRRQRRLKVRDLKSSAPLLPFPPRR